MKRRTFIKSLLSLGSGIVLLDSLWLEKYYFHTPVYPIHKGLSSSIKVIQISDLHLKRCGRVQKKIAEYVNNASPDLICLTGDAIEKEKQLKYLDEFMGLLDYDIPKVAVPGNWEYWSKIDFSVLDLLYKKHNCQLLVNSSVGYSKNGIDIGVIGVDDLLAGSPDIRAAIQPGVSFDIKIVLNHCPQYTDFIDDKYIHDIDLILSGHTHGGQINILGFVPYIPGGSGNYVRGWYDKMYVSQGIGTSGIPFRFGSRSEVATFVFN